MGKWYPIDVRGDRQKEEAYDALLDDVPVHLREFLTRFMRAVLRSELRFLNTDSWRDRMRD